MVVNRRADRKWIKREANARLSVKKEEVMMERRHLALSAKSLRESAERQVWTTIPVHGHGESSSRCSRVSDNIPKTPSYGFSAFLDMTTEEDAEDETPIVPTVVEQANVSCNQRPAPLDWKEIENKLPLPAAHNSSH